MSTKNEPLFFLFTCVKNGSHFIEKLFSSLIKQTSKNFVHYIYDDGSDDDIESVVLRYMQEVKKLDIGYDIIYEHNDINIGLNLSTKHCIDKCLCRYFIWIDCDNWIDDHFFEKMEKIVVKNQNAIVFRSNCCVISEDNNKIIKDFKKRVFNKRNDISILMDNYYYSFFAVDYKKYIDLDETNYFINKRDVFNDVQVLFKCSLSGYDFVFAKEARGFMLLRKNSEFNKFNTFDYLEKEHSFLSLLQHTNSKRIDYDIHDVLLARNTLETIKLNNKEKKYIDNIYLVKEKRRLLKKNGIDYRYGEVYLKDWVAIIIYCIRAILRH